MQVTPSSRTETKFLPIVLAAGGLSRTAHKYFDVLDQLGLPATRNSVLSECLAEVVAHDASQESNLGNEQGRSAIWR